ncbi:MAG: FAD-binding oxidoreductase [Acidobacteria bacterium]|nr:FAD-binding oxidoreductase [Acidobacteriota bacterium]
MSYQTKISGWGRFPVTETRENRIRKTDDIRTALAADGSILARGLGRSYGDASLAPEVLSMLPSNRMLAFNEKTGLLRCESGVSLDEILRTFVPRGWFLPVTPGTRFVTIGGAIASDVHGKNHHVAGSFCDHISSLKIMTADGKIKSCSPRKNTALFRASCGGNGLTGVIVEAGIRLIPVESAWIRQTTVKAANLDELTAQFEMHKTATYSVAWIDCLAGGDAMGRGILFAGEHAAKEEVKEKFPLVLKPGPMIPVPVSLPAFTLNPLTVRLFNNSYFNLAARKPGPSLVNYRSFFYPLDKVANWNRIYGSRGFVQYQFVLPESAGITGLRNILGEIVAAGTGSFLAVLKQFGKGNGNFLSFPMAGWTLALDFPEKPSVFQLLDRLDSQVSEMGGRIYLTKDSRMSAETFRTGYREKVNAFMKIKGETDPGNRFASLQSKRLEITP